MAMKDRMHTGALYLPGITPLTMPKSLRIWRKSNKYKTNPADSRNGRLRGDFLYVSRCPAEICKIRSNPCGAGR